MVEMPDVVVKAMNDPKAFKVLATIAPDGAVHAIQVGAMVAPQPNIIAVGAILMQHTSMNLEEMQKKGQTATVVMGKEMESYQVKVEVKGFQTEGPIFDKMAPEIEKLGLKLRGVWLLEPIEVWNQSASYEAGKRMV